MRVYASMATYSGHAHTVRRALQTLANVPEVERIFLWQNDFVIDHDELNRLIGDYVDVFMTLRAPGPAYDLGDTGKFYGPYHGVVDDVVWLICDDDLEYPPDYAKKMLEALERYEYKAAVSFHGARLVPPVNNYRGCREGFSCLRDVHRDEVVHVLGTGTLGFHSSLFDPPLTMEDFPVKNMADLWFAKVLQERKIPAVVAKHERGWIKSLLGPKDPTLWKAGELPETTELVRSLDWQLHEP
jgi:hypothetical protein